MCVTKPQQLVRSALFKLLLRDKSAGALGYTTRFALKYVPRFDRISTERGVEGKREVPKTATHSGGVERAALVALLVAAGTAGVVAWVGVKVIVTVAAWSGLV